MFRYTDPATGTQHESYDCEGTRASAHFREGVLEAYLWLQFKDHNGNNIGGIVRRHTSTVYKSVTETRSRIPVEGEKVYHQASNRYGHALVRYGNDITVRWTDNSHSVLPFQALRVVYEIHYEPRLNDPIANQHRIRGHLKSQRNA